MIDPPGAMSGRVVGATAFELCAKREPLFDRTETIAARDGSWHLEGLSPGKWRVQVLSESASAVFEAIVRSGSTTDTGAIALEPFGTVRGRVVDPGGAPLARVEVVGLSLHTRNIHAETDEEGWYEMQIPAGWVHVDVPFGHHGAIRGDVRAGEIVELAPIRVLRL